MAVIVKKEMNENENLSASQITYRLPTSGSVKKSVVQPKTQNIASPESSRLHRELGKTFIVSLVIFVLLALLYFTLR